MSRDPLQDRRPPSVVVWDVGNVLIPWDRRGALGILVDDAAEVDRLAEEVFTDEVNLLLDSGRTPHEVAGAVEASHPGHGWVVHGYVEHFLHSLGPADPGCSALVDTLGERGTRCVGLSNFAAVTWEQAVASYEVLGRLEGVVISGDAGICKPDPDIYRLCEQRFGFAPTEAVFVDDRPENVDGALAVGWDAVLHEDSSSTADALRDRGLL